MRNPKPVVVEAAHQVNQELSALGVTREIIVNVARAAAAGKADALPVDPINAAGSYAYFKGVRSIRLQMLPLGWRLSRLGSVEATVNDELGIQLCFQNVDMACTEHEPNAISGKGSGSRQLIYAGHQGELFVRADDKPVQMRGVVPLVWVVCVSTEGKKLRAELSCPNVFDGKQFEGFTKRIWVLDEDYDPTTPQPDIKPDEDGGFDAYEVKIAKK